MRHGTVRSNVHVIHALQKCSHARCRNFVTWSKDQKGAIHDTDFSLLDLSRRYYGATGHSRRDMGALLRSRIKI